MLAALAMITGAKAQIVQGSFRTGNITIYGTTWNDVEGIDFNNDGTLEFRIQTNDYQPYVYFSYDYTDGGNNMVSDPEMWDYVAVLAEGTPINASCNYTGYGDGSFEDLAALSGTIYIGMRFRLSDGLHYGWAKGTVSGTTVNWQSCYYNATPNAAINAGQTSGGTNAIATAETSSLRACAIGNRTIRLEGDSEQVQVVDMSGHVVATVSLQGQHTLQLPGKGLYVVRAAGRSTKVVAY